MSAERELEEAPVMDGQMDEMQILSDVRHSARFPQSVKIKIGKEQI